MPYLSINSRKPDLLQKVFAWLVVIDYLLLSTFLLKLNSLTLNAGVSISILLVFYNILLTFLCFRRARRAEDFYTVYPVLSATLLAFVLFLYFFFMLP
ncbi:hypothetical protein CSW98_09425 [Vibrio sp. HA2012]|uniref:hypothetical protein n=1 Tax=Vibrio sp. HA2012 TaxID=1971595 RepID=UPI000C2CA722|nr:hypothetical protein [Vibrio sp. HA2012]PJC86422.1 hypothetical protein CSW98_09425 [Vibrio sp. HA2012]